ncbi:MAG: hypothetical protein HY597_06105 [Candidatus Omnitrophica bacterium]|nr:hypothetical protein [Candidatus Omnitrophota bacterium]
MQRRRRSELRWALVAVICGLSLSGFVDGAALAADAQRKEQGSAARTAKGLHFDFPPDWPIEERNGIVAPIPLQEYLDRKLSGLDPGKLKGLETKLNAIEGQLNSMDLRLRLLEEKSKRGLRSTEAPADEPATTPTAVRAR